MPEKTELLRALILCVKGDGTCDECPYDPRTGGGCIDQILTSALEVLQAQPPPIRCAECRYFRRGGNPDGFGWCNRPGAGCSLPEDYYCKYGTKKEADNG